MTKDLSSLGWRQVSWVAFDTETSGRYPVESEICEIAAVKWTATAGAGVKRETFSALVKPSRTMSEEVIRIHGITNEMVASAPPIKDVLPGFVEFIRGSVLLAHHAQFDLGFVAAALEDAGLSLPPEPTVCTSLLAQGNVPETPNHRLQTLVPFFGINPGQAHRALDDANACLEVAMNIFMRLQKQNDEMGGEAYELTVKDIAAKQLRRTKLDLGPLYFQRFSLDEIKKNADIARFIEAAKLRRKVEMVYAGGSRPGKPRTVNPIGVIRQLDGDALVALEEGETVAKRYWLKDVRAIS
ncbi:MAG: 3'-5' exonuclease [Bdellovibrionales bacterium]|jgi:DNA polymerase-3 subunit epsilon|nr:3'-5' exonuclease [Bdellovibrionales bacterium]